MFLIYKIVLGYRIGDFTWRVSDCEELVGVAQWGDVTDLVMSVSL